MPIWILMVLQKIPVPQVVMILHQIRTRTNQKQMVPLVEMYPRMTVEVVFHISTYMDHSKPNYGNYHEEDDKSSDDDNSDFDLDAYLLDDVLSSLDNKDS